MEAELFGYEKGAFTGAASGGKIGLIEAAANNTLLLDEVNSMPLSLQAKLLRAIQNREITRRQWEGLDQEERPDLCHRCGQCERRCPQHLRIRAQLAQVTGDVARFLRGEPDGSEPI